MHISLFVKSDKIKLSQVSRVFETFSVCVMKTVSKLSIADTHLANPYLYLSTSFDFRASITQT